MLIDWDTYREAHAILVGSKIGEVEPLTSLSRVEPENPGSQIKEE